MVAAWEAAAQIDVSQEGATIVLSFRGELDIEARESFESIVLAAIPTTHEVILDLGELTFCDSSGLSLLIAATDKAAAERTVLRFRNVHPTVRRVFRVTGLDEVLDILDEPSGGDCGR
jgi:anti-sigma B factor antagonist